MRLNAQLIAAFLALSAMGAPALAGADSSSRYDRWEQRLRDRVTALHKYPLGAEKGARGDVLVSFKIGSDGEPVDITIRQSSGEATFDNAAVRLVAGLGKLGPIPGANGRVERIILKLSYGDPASLDDARRDTSLMAQERLANERRNRLLVSKAKNLVAER